MKERPILFSAPMVRAILDGTKTQTRRVVKVKHLPWLENSVLNFLNGKWNQRPLPYGKPSDRLWVREAWRIGAWSEDSGSIAIDYQADGSSRREWLDVPNGDDFLRYWQQSTDDAIKVFGGQDKYKWEPGQSPCRWRPSIHMPRFASRITLEITGVRVERLQDISKADSVAEGVRELPLQAAEPGCWWTADVGAGAALHGRTPSNAYRLLWESINGPSSWDQNPWVWVVEFKRI